jgi:hypothetical protein
VTGRTFGAKNGMPVVTVTYDDGTIVTTTFDDSGNPSIHINKPTVVNAETREIRVAPKN